MKKALLIGINYKHTSNELTGCINDVDALKKMLLKQCNYTNVSLITENENIKPTKDNILKALKNIIDESKKYTEIWIHYSGHGTPVKDLNGDEKDGFDEAIVPLDFETNGFIIDDDLNSIISKTKCKTYITFDCCHSGSALDLYYNLSVQKNKLVHSFELSQKNKSTKNNIFMISGCTDSQKSEENKNQIGGNFIQMGAMTTTLIKVLQKYKFNISIEKLMIELNKYMLKDNHSQIPVFSSNQPILLKSSFVTPPVAQIKNKKREFKTTKSKYNNSSENFDHNLKKIIKKIIKKELKKLLSEHYKHYEH